MLSPQTFTKDWLHAKAKASGAVNAQIFERCVHAFELVGRLAEAKLDFIFKGGTSLILHLEPVRRLSVDVDITSTPSSTSLVASDPSAASGQAVSFTATVTGDGGTPTGDVLFFGQSSGSTTQTLLGQATVAHEFEAQAPGLDAVLVAVGGGGLIGGMAAWYQGRTRLVAVEPEAAPTLTRALEAGHPVEAPAGGVAADSLAPKQVGGLMFPLAQRHVDRGERARSGAP